MQKRCKHLLAALLALVLLAAAAPGARAAGVSVTVDGAALVGAALYDSTTYVPLRAACALLCPEAAVSWEGGTAWVRAPGLTLSARPGDCYILANGRALYAAAGVRLVNGVTLVPVRALARAFGAEVGWDTRARAATVGAAGGFPESGDTYYDADELYWLSRIIEAESGGEPLLGKLAVGNTILNRVASDDYPDSIYGVIFDREWGVQYEPVLNGTVYNEPSAESVLAAKLCLDGADVVGEALFFLNPEKATNFWIMENRAYLTTIGNHWFYL